MYPVMPECIFCSIIAKKIPADIIYEDDDVVVFKDIKPSAPIHWLIVPKKHTQTPADTDAQTLGLMAKIGARVTNDNGIDEKGYKLVINVGKGGGQIVNHIHMHVLAGFKTEPSHEGR